jgi:hypothetical protein
MKSNPPGHGRPTIMNGDWSLMPKTPAEARAAESVYYFDGRACARGHVAPRRVHNSDCYQCVLDRAIARNQRKREEGRPAREAAAAARRAAREAAKPSPEARRLRNRALRQRHLHERLREVGTEAYFSAEAAKAKADYWANPEKQRARRRERGRRGLAGHRLHKLRTPPWQSPQESDAIKRFYEACPAGHEVEHIIPFVDRRIAGLHVLENLRYMKPRANKQKLNHWHGTDDDILDAIRSGLAVFPFDVSETGEVDWEKYRDV